MEYIVHKSQDDAARLKGAYIKYGENVNVGTGTVIVHAYPSDAEPFQEMITFDIVPREVTVVVDSKEKNYGDADPAFTCYLDPSTTGGVDPDTLYIWRPQLAQYVTMTREAGELPGTYAITTVKTTPFKFAGKNVVVTAVTPGTLTVTANPADWAETATDEYTIKSAAGWDVFCDLLAAADGKTFFSGKTVKLGADIGSADNPITRRAGSADYDFTGHFDGQGHTLYVRLGTAEAPHDTKAAPFQNVTTVSNTAASIENLRVCGDIYASGKYAAGIIGSQYGNVTLRNCRSSVNIHSSAADDTSSGGLVGNGHENLTIEGCLFDGSLTAEAAGAIKCAGFVGYYGSSATLSISNSLVAPASVTIGTGTIGTGTSGAISATFARGWSGTPANSYYTAPPSGGWGATQGKQARTIKASYNVTTNYIFISGEGVTVAHAGEATTYDVSGITAYKATGASGDDDPFIAGILYDDVLYAGNGDEVSLTLGNTPPDDYAFHSYTVSAGTLSSDSPSGDGGAFYTVTMPDENVWVEAMFAPLPISVSYIDENGVKQTVDDAINLSAFDGKIPAGSVCSFSREYAFTNPTIAGDVTIIIPDDLEISTDYIYGNYTVTIYGQEKGNGKLNVSVYFGGSVTFYGGNVSFEGDVMGNVELSWTKPSNSFYATTIVGSARIFKTFYDEGGNPYTGPIPGSSVQGKTLRPYDCRLSLSDAASNSAAIDAANGLVYNVTLSGRTLYKDGAWNTLCLPFDVSTTSGPLSGDNVEAMVLRPSDSGLQGTTLNLYFDTVSPSGEQEGLIAAGTPFIIRWGTPQTSPGTTLTDPVFTGVTVSSTTAGSVKSTDGTVQFNGTYDWQEYTEEDKSILFLGEGNTLYYPQPSGGTNPSIGAFRAYFELTDPSATVRQFVLNFGEGDEAQGITTTDYTDFTDKAGAWYTIDGVKLDGKPTKKGMYIHGAKKVVIK